MHLTLPPPYKDFARELGRLTERKRKETWSGGRRVDTATFYAVPERRSEAVELAEIRKLA